MANVRICVMMALAGFGSILAMPTFADEAALATLRRYSSALMANDCETMYALTSNAIRRRDTVSGEFHAMLCRTVPEWHRAHLKETLGLPIGELSDGDNRILVVPAQRSVDEPPNRLVTSLEYVVHSGDGGKHWWVIDLACVDERWVKEVYPAYAGTPLLQHARLEILPLQHP